MKEIKTAKYVEKEAIWSLPGDPELPPGVGQRDIDERFEGGESNVEDNQEGEIELTINWPEFNQWFAKGGEEMPVGFRIRTDPSTILVKYLYTYDNNMNIVDDIKGIEVIDGKTDQKIEDEYIVSSFIDFYKERIKADIAETRKIM
jgi:hypothetical protein